VLTVVGYSLNDTIIIFDRVRENLRKYRRQNLYEILNLSINETLPRSVLTHGTTIATTLALLLLAGEVIRPFAWVMSFGIFRGTSGLSATAGIHPHEAREWSDAARDRVRALLAAPEMVAVGETGLDYHYMHAPREIQRSAFAAQLALAAELGKPVIVHARQADADMAALLRSLQPR